MSRLKKATPEVLTPEQIEEKCDAMDDDWTEVYDLSRQARIAGDAARADELLMIACGMRQLGIDFRHKQDGCGVVLTARAHRVQVRRRRSPGRKPAISLT